MVIIFDPALSEYYLWSNSVRMPAQWPMKVANLTKWCGDDSAIQAESSVGFSHRYASRSNS